MNAAEQPDSSQAESASTGGSASLRTLLRVSLAVLLVILLLRLFVLAPYAIPSDSMYPTILDGDALLVNTLPFYIRSPNRIPFTTIEIPALEIPGPGTLERGDIVVFDATEQRRSYHGATELVKRCVALPGDRVQLMNGMLSVNGGAPALPYPVQPINPDRAFSLLRNNRQVTVPYKGYEIALDSASAEAWKEVLESENVQVTYRNNIVFLNGRPATLYRFTRDYFFAVGDNSGDSYDSRQFGFVPRENLVGRAFVVYWSRDPEKGIRWSRIGEWLE